jgi:phage terminase large subunit-like protein
VDYAVIERDIIADCERFHPSVVAYDDWNASDLVNRLVDQEVPMINFIQGPRSYHPAMQELERAYISGRLVHENSPVLTWHAANMAARYDQNMNSAPDRRKSSEKIDGMCALLMAVGVAVSGVYQASVYETRGLTEAE